MEEAKVIVVEHGDDVTEIRLNRPKALNSLDAEMTATILKHIKANKSKVLLMTGSGETSYCAGGDIVAAYNEYK